MDKLYRLVDVNLNRAREGLRVIEDIARFYLDDKRLSGMLKEIRHNITNTVKNNKILLLSRDAGSDVGRRFNPLLEGGKKKIRDVVISNFRRVEESLRVLEDVSKIIMPRKTSAYKNLRYKIYSVEKKFCERF